MKIPFAYLHGWNWNGLLLNKLNSSALDSIFAIFVVMAVIADLIILGLI